MVAAFDRRIYLYGYNPKIMVAIEERLVWVDSGIPANCGPAVDERVGQCLGRTFGYEHKATQSVLQDPFGQRDWSKQVTGHGMNGHGVELIRQMNHALDPDDLSVSRQNFVKYRLEARPANRLG